LATVPERVAEVCRKESCDLLLLSGDIFDGTPSGGTVASLRNILASLEIPVFIAPGNHDFATSGSPWLTELWPENVHIFTKSAVSSVSLPVLDCRVYGGAFTAMDCPSLLEGFRADHAERYRLGIFHGDPTNLHTPYCPVTLPQIRDSGLSYLALGHIHKQGHLQAGDTLCAWPGCPAGRGYDETGDKGVLLVTLGDTVTTEFLPLGLPRFFDLTAEPGDDAFAALEAVLPPAGTDDYYRITLTGPSVPLNLPELQKHFSRFPNLELTDKTRPPVDLWRSAGEDSLEGVFFSLLKTSLEQQEGRDREITLLAAKLARDILDGREVLLP
jgi:DNA repair exonuclease SbcCD nuclease subunit